jgi:hypothetical protein
MRLAALAVVSAFGLTVASASAGAVQIVPMLDDQQASNIIQIAGGCGRGFHPNRWGYCAPNRRYGYRYRPYYRYSYRPYYRDYYYGGGYRTYPGYRYGY